jgi:hypothetical protein
MKWYVTAYEMVCYRFKQPKQVTQESMQPLWATAYGNGMLPLMEMVCYRFRQPKQVTQESMQPLWATAYGNGVSPPKIPRTAAPILKKG